MFRRSLLRATRRQPLPSPRPYTTTPPKPPITSQSRITRFNRRLPTFLHKYTNALATAPLSHITSFLLLHELTAVIPLFSLAAYFHYTHWLPPWFAEGAWIASGVERFGRYFKRKGWIRDDEAAEAVREVGEMQEEATWRAWMVRRGWVRSEGVGVASEEDVGREMETRGLRKVDHAWNIGEGGVRLVVEFATAYAIVKMFLVPRIMLSVWATPWFARWTVLPVMRRFRARSGARRKGVVAGTGAVEGGVVPKGRSGKGS